MSSTPEDDTTEEELTDEQISEMLREHIQPIFDRLNSIVSEEKK